MRTKALFVSAAIAVSVLGASGALAKPHDKADKPHKKLVGVIVSFAASAEGSDSMGMLTYTPKGATETTDVTVASDVQIKLRHRGEHAKSETHGNPSRGDLDDLVAGATILRMKMDDGSVSKLRLKMPAVESTEDEALPEEEAAVEAPPEEETAEPDEAP